MAEPLILQASAADTGARLDAWVSKQCPELTRSAAQNLIAEGHLLLNDQPAKKNDRLKSGDVLSLTIPEPVLMEATPQDIPLDIVFEDAHLLVINKPKGMVVHPAPGHPDGTLVNALLHHCKGQLSGINGVIRPGIVHRIDRDTSGLLVVAKTDTAHLGLAEQIADHSCGRTYEAVICGRLQNQEGTVNAPIGRDPNNRQKMCVTDRNSREAITHYTTLAEYAQHTHIQCRLETGRTHQIRVHMRYIGHPVYGDGVYGKAVKGLQGQCLHARELRFTHPITGQPMCFTCQLPDYFQMVLRQISRL
ncbi:MAG: RluA family pseudouridine synthase [Oscillospiraceae bacterium]|nr:RluA family pseudouridine synthase [Oscillospiraceae bacterium]